MSGTRRIPADAAGVSEAIRTLRAGGLVVIPTDTVYGIAVDLRTQGGVERLFAAKRRPPDKAIMVLVDGIDQLEGLVELSPAALVLAAAGWPGGLTLVLPLRDVVGLPAALTAGTATLGVRMPDHAVPRTIARAIGPLPATSANRSGDSAALAAAAADSALGDEVDLVVDGGPVRGGVASTVVDCTAVRPRVLRVGAIAPIVLAAALDEAGLGHDIESG
ncbi:MAG: L-threonylcarbamoyladenylate synthase [Candidatus Limnocylindrales bacterium]